MMKKKKRVWKVAGLSILAAFILAGIGFGYEYYQLQPKNHFKSVPVVNSGKSQNSVEQTVKQLDSPVFNILLIGSDERKGQNIGHSDSMMLVHVDLSKNEFQAVSIPRDTRIHLDGYGYTKLTSVQYIMQAKKGAKQGVEAAVNAVSELTGVPINYYVETNYWGFQSMVDAVGGINMDVPFDVKLTHPWYPENANKVITTGTHSLGSKMVTEIVHERYSLQNGEYGRQQLQEEALKGIAKKALQPSNVTKLPSLIKSIPDYVLATNMSTEDMLSLGMAVKDFDPNKQLKYHQLRGSGQKLYDDILKAKNDQIVLDPKEIKRVFTNNFQS
ncbi:LCP family protein [Bacillota bacterium Lsc_1132]